MSTPTTPREIARLPYRRGVGIMLFNGQGQVFVARRIDTTQAAWQMPQGGIDEGETPRQAARRELREEIGTDKIAFVAESRSWLRYDLPVALVPKVWGGRFRGQEQKWFAARFLGTAGDIDIATEHPEFNAWRWAELETLPALIVPFKRGLYAALAEEFAPFIGGARRDSGSRRKIK